ncbi:MAG: Uma2 family endonuclease [Parvularculaceae bacterium]|nr:Uma2 family endonuclease [Parvularculaceae bacterium]
MNKQIGMRTDGLERHRFSTVDIDRMVAAGILEAEGRWELIDGEIVPMAAQHTPHARVVSHLFRTVFAAIETARYEVFLGAMVELSPSTRLDPDLYVAKAGLTSKIVPASAVLWAVEVSDSTRRKDLKIKAPLYADAGIPEYWVIDVEERVTHIHRGLSADGWREPIRVAPFTEAIAPAAFPAISVRLD